ncbi:MAG: PA domain-containing protein [Crocinitomicaceae bacterium]
MSLLMVSAISNAQIVVYVNAPSANEGSYEFTYAQGASWGVPDLTVPGNAVEDTMVFVNDGTAGDSLGCNGLINGVDVNGQIAVVYRGSCEFGTKALNAQNAGAVGVIIINNAGGAPLEMGGGADGGGVSIPVVMITNAAGALLKQEIENQTSTVFIGSKNGLYGDDLAIRPSETLRAHSFGVLQPLSQDGTEFNFEVGAWIRNYGTNSQGNVQLHCTVDLGVTNLYDQTSTAVTIPAGDSAFVSLPTFSQPTYANGFYEMTYEIIMTATDESDYDNTWDANFFINDSLFSHATMDPVGMEPVPTFALYNGDEGDGGFAETCIFFRDTNASRLGVFGMTINAFTSQNPDPTSLDGKYVEIFAYTWDNAPDSASHWTTVAEWEGVSLSSPPIAQANYIYIDDLQGENLFIPFESTPLLVDNQAYLFCYYVESGIYPGYDNKVDYSLNMALYDQPVNMVHTDAEARWYAAGFGNGKQPSMMVHFFTPDQLGVMENAGESNLSVYPNPATDKVSVLLKENYGNVFATLTNLEGKVVSTQNVTMEANILVLDVTTLASGTYMVDINYNGEEHQVFKVVVTK